MLWGFLGFESRLPFPVWGRSEPFCRDLAFLSTKWLWDRFSSLQNGMASNSGPTKWCCLSTVLDLFHPQPLSHVHPKLVKHAHFVELPHPQEHGSNCLFSRCHFVEQNPVNCPFWTRLEVASCNFCKQTK